MSCSGGFVGLLAVRQVPRATATPVSIFNNVTRTSFIGATVKAGYGFANATAVNSGAAFTASSESFAGPAFSSHSFRDVHCSDTVLDVSNTKSVRIISGGIIALYSITLFEPSSEVEATLHNGTLINNQVLAYNQTAELYIGMGGGFRLLANTTGVV